MSANAYTIEGLLAFMYDEVTKDAPDNWRQVLAIFEMTTLEGKNNVKAKYVASIPDSIEVASFQTSNLWGPINAALEIQELERSRGNELSVLTVRMNPDGKVSYSRK
mgnify:CR=1 FL=1|tara:strand:- start:173 stop:493 length:321 start_codon:yes stop_codon:yes gene_type:complete